MIKFLPFVRKTVIKEGPNKGRVFLSCPKPMGQGCNFFQWSDQTVNLGGPPGEFDEDVF